MRTSVRLTAGPHRARSDHRRDGISKEYAGPSQRTRDTIFAFLEACGDSRRRLERCNLQYSGSQNARLSTVATGLQCVAKPATGLDGHRFSVTRGLLPCRRRRRRNERKWYGRNQLTIKWLFQPGASLPPPWRKWYDYGLNRPSGGKRPAVAWNCPWRAICTGKESAIMWYEIPRWKSRGGVPYLFTSLK